MTATDILGCTGVAAIVGVLALMRLVLSAMVDASLADDHAPAATQQQQAQAQASTASDPALPADTLIEIGDAAFTPDEASRIIDLKAYYEGKQVTLPWRGTRNGNGTGGDAA